MSAHRPLTKVLVVEDHPLILEGVRSVVAQEASLRLVAVAASGERAMDQLDRECVDVALIDTSLPDTDCAALIGRVRTRCPRAKVIVLAAGESPDARAFFAAGAHCVLRKLDTTATKLAECLVRCAPEGCATNRPSRGLLAGLSARELQVVRLVASGMSNKEIGATLGIVDRTVETYRLRIGRKLGLTGAAALTRWAIENGVGGPPKGE
ncbi:MAG: response regulator transcription factor [Myxococcales bacterium]|nr:response regulator transcription factor [Myxococcales bacterium]